MPINVLGIESSCDETSAAVISNTKILSNIIANQDVHQKYGGVVPELASRAHLKNIIPVVDRAIAEANIEKKDLDAIAYTRGPGLLGSLLVGSSFGKSLSLSLNIPLIEVNHMQAHLLAHFIDDNSENKTSFPFLGVNISGGHTQIVLCKDYFKMEIIGESLDDSIGEAYDKCGKMMGLNYPAGPKIDEFARKGNPTKFKFSIPKVSGLDFSFSGLKTNFKRFIDYKSSNNKLFINEERENLCSSLQETITKILIDKIVQASKNTGIKNIVFGGGVSANSRIRESANRELKNFKLFFPKIEYTTDNAAMIAVVGYLKYREKKFTNYGVESKARYKI
ncbi:MAG: tRNA (adenosine(37)-N6)-threonylcarbamoyltransferase complex transferase subunit TsaD [Bacteroidota bacterium]|nr:tRNA (adenosine(37)-N6)-threonylcarbamoyltransferase complex transferase subunit TsaD [Bacteroidota bacterium]